MRDDAGFQGACTNVTLTRGRSPHGSGTWLTAGDLRRQHVAPGDLTTPGTTRGREIWPAIAHLAKVSPCATSSHLSARASYRMSFTLDKFPSVCRKKPNAVGVKRRLAATEPHTAPPPPTARCPLQLLVGLTPTDAAYHVLLQRTLWRLCCVIPTPSRLRQPLAALHTLASLAFAACAGPPECPADR
jgi:hypothetical protein